MTETNTAHAWGMVYHWKTTDDMTLRWSHEIGMECRACGVCSTGE